MNSFVQDPAHGPANDGGWICQVGATLPMLTLATAQVRGVRAAYRLEPRRGAITFTAQRLGLFNLAADAPAYSGQVVVDMEQCRITGVDLTIDPAALRVSTSTGTDRSDWSGLAHSLRRLPRLRFRSTSLPDPQGALRGLLDLGGMPRLQTLRTLAASRREDPITGTDLAMFDLSAEVQLGHGLPGLARALAGDTARLHLTLTTEIEPGF